MDVRSFVLSWVAGWLALAEALAAGVLRGSPTWPVPDPALSNTLFRDSMPILLVSAPLDHSGVGSGRAKLAIILVSNYGPLTLWHRLWSHWLLSTLHLPHLICPAYSSPPITSMERLRTSHQMTRPVEDHQRMQAENYSNSLLTDRVRQ